MSSSNSEANANPFEIANVAPVNLDLNGDIDTKMVMADGHASRKMGRAMTRKSEENDLNILRAIFMTTLMLCVMLEIYSWYAARVTDSWSLLALAFASIIMISVTFQGALGCYRAAKDLGLPNLATISSTNSGQEILLHSIFYLIPVLAIYCVLGTGALLFPDEVVAYQRAIHQNDPTYAHDSDKMSSYLEMVEVFVTTGGYTTYMICLLFLASYYYYFQLTYEYEAIHTLLQIHNWVLLSLALSMIAVAVYEINYLSFFGINEDFIDYVPIGVILLATKFVSMSFMGLRAGYTEDKHHIGCYMVSLAIFMTMGGFLIVGVWGFSMSFMDQFEDVCEHKLDLVGDEYLQSLGCVGKYLREVDGEYPCDNPVPIPDSDPELGCLNLVCCETLVTHGVNRFNYMASLGSTLVLFAALSLINGGFLLKKVDRFSRSYIHRYDGVITLLMIGTLVIALGTIAFCFFTVPDLS